MILKVDENDNVAVALSRIIKGDTLPNVIAVDDIPIGHKIALTQIAEGDKIIKYGSPIGSATAEIEPGAFVHTHNIKTNLMGIEQYTYNPVTIQANYTASKSHFMGYKRPDGKVGIRNEIWIVNTVGCVNKIAEKLVSLTAAENVHTFVHPYGCSQLGEDHRFTQQILAAMVNHPNAAGVLILGLGCENNHIDSFRTVLGEWDSDRVKFLNTQDVQDEIAEGLKLIDKLVEHAAKYTREPIPMSELIVGLKCGGSDGLSGITANPLVGCFSDKLISHGGTSILTEVPEMFGAETLLMGRAKDKVVFRKTVELINNFKEYFVKHGQEIYENPSPGNKEGGISTLEEKSLGCTQKGGNSYITDVLDYGEVVKTKGLNLLQGPGNDIVAVTNLMAAGAHMVLFTTGRGTPLGAPVPTVKISSNTALAKLKPHWIDFDAGVLVSKNKKIDDLTLEFFNYLLSVASGHIQTKNELNNYREISIFKDGVTL